MQKPRKQRLRMDATDEEIKQASISIFRLPRLQRLQRLARLNHFMSVQWVALHAGVHACVPLGVPYDAFVLRCAELGFDVQADDNGRMRLSPDLPLFNLRLVDGFVTCSDFGLRRARNEAGLWQTDDDSA